MRILVVAEELPWPPRSGGRQRLHWMLRMLCSHADVDLLIVGAESRREKLTPPPEVPLGRLAVVVAGQPTMPTWLRLVRWLVTAHPRSLVGRDWSAARSIVREWTRADYDLVWFVHSPVYLALRDHLPEPHVVDMDNLESSLLAQRRTSRRWRSAGSMGVAVWERVRAAADRIDERRWRRFERDIVRTAAVSLVCSDLDAQRLDEARVSVVPNGYERSSAVAGIVEGRRAIEAPVLLFVGLLIYEPNRDAVVQFAREVLPLIRARIPHARFRIVGRYHPSDLREVSGLPGVEVVGEVPDVAVELVAADVAVVPVRFGGGTRIKILEAFAFGVPVVSTSVGCEGLDVSGGRHLLLADQPDAFAAACCELLGSGELREAISREAQLLWERRYRWVSVEPVVHEVLERAVGDHR